MALCDYGIYKFITEKYYDELCNLTPLERAVKIFDLEIEHLNYELHQDDEIFGWFTFKNDPQYKGKSFPDTVRDWSDDASWDFGCKTSVDKGHTLSDYDYILQKGLNGYKEQIEKGLAEFPDDKELLAMQETLLSVEKFVLNIRSALEKQGTVCAKTEKIKNAMVGVPFKPASTFREAVQSVWLVHFLTPLAGDAWYSISLGHFDQYLYPYYKKSLQDGMTREEAKSILRNFYLLLNNYSDGACLLNIGGENYNELSELIIECQSELALPAPILGALITEDTPDHIWNKLIDEHLFSAGQPTFYGKQACIRALKEKGLPERETKKFSNNSCMGISIPGQEVNSMWGCVFSVSAVLEAAINNGNLLCKNISVPGIMSVHSLEGLYTQFEKALSYIFDICVQSYESKAEFYDKFHPVPFISMLTEACIQNRAERYAGAKYHNATIECMGMVNVSDGICAIDELVFKQKKYTLQEMIEAVKTDFQNYPMLLKDVLNCPKFGQNNEADLYAARVADIMQKVIRTKSHDNLYYAPSLHTLDANVTFGRAWGASFDGRKAGEPFAKNAGPSNCVRKKEHTSNILSSAKLPQHQFYGGQPIDINFNLDAVKNHKNAIRELIKLYLFNGGIQMQVNALSSKVLEDAVQNPELHKNLVVRIGGYSDYFNRFPEKTKLEFIERIKYEER